MKKINFALSAKFIGFAFIFAATSLFIGFNVIRLFPKSPASDPISVNAMTDNVIIIDAGHGGEDGGAFSSDGTLEKDINLAISNDLAAIFRIAGFNVKTSRSDDRMLYDMYSDLNDYSRLKKAYDLKNRLRFAKENNGTLFIGIHCNKFPDARCHGMQIFYSPKSPKSAELAESLKKYNNLYREPDNTREIKKATSSIFVLNNIEIPAILVECGFLSNTNDTEKLNAPAERAKIAVTVFAAICDSLTDVDAS